MENQPIFLNESVVKNLLTWPEVYEAVKAALQSVCEIKQSDKQPISSQPARSFTFMPNKSDVLLSMPGFIGNYKLPSQSTEETYQTMACKLVTIFGSNEKLEQPLPNIMGTIFLFDSKTGKLNALLEATEITAWRTAAASLVATNYLYFNRKNLTAHENDNNEEKILSIVGCGVQGRINAIAMCNTFKFSEIHLWNRTPKKAELLANELNLIKNNFKNINTKISVFQNVEECVKDADVIVIATNSSQPLIHFGWLKNNVHINAIGSGTNHHAELSLDVYENGKIYVDYWTGAKTELKTLKAEIIGEVGEVINGLKQSPSEGDLTIFQSLGMAVEDAAVAQMILEKHTRTKLN